MTAGMWALYYTWDCGLNGFQLEKERKLSSGPGAGGCDRGLYGHSSLLSVGAARAHLKSLESGILISQLFGSTHEEDSIVADTYFNTK